MKIWFNQGHTLYQTLRGMEERVPGITLVVSARHALSPAAMAGSIVWVEPEGLYGDAYVDWAFQQALDNGVDIFFPQKEVVAIASQEKRFADAGIQLELPASAETIQLLNDKSAMAADLAGDPILAPTIRVTSSRELEDAVAQIRSLGVQACVKPSEGVFAQGYWHLVDVPLLSCLDDIKSRRMPLATYLAALREAEDNAVPFDLIVMEHLPGTEASVDAHVRNGKLLRAVTRVKVRGSRQEVIGGHELEETAERLIARYSLNGIVNLQFKPTHKGEWKILEINPRMAGGLSYTMPIGIDLAADWVKAAIGQEIEPVRTHFKHDVNFHTEATIRIQ